MTRTPPKTPDIAINVLTPALQEAYNTEKKRWSKAYGLNGTFTQQINHYHALRQEFTERFNAGTLTKDQVHLGSLQLGTSLARAYGQIDTKGEWIPDVAEKIKIGGADYANSSVNANMYQQMPGVLRSVAVLSLLIAAAEKAIEEKNFAIAMVVVNSLYAILQGIAFCLVPPRQAQTQSIDVANRATHGPDYLPDVVASKLINEDGNPGELKGIRALQEQIKNLENIKKMTPVEFKKSKLDRLTTDSEIKFIELKSKHQAKIEKNNIIQPHEHAENKELLKEFLKFTRELNFYKKILSAQAKIDPLKPTKSGLQADTWNQDALNIIDETLLKLQNQSIIEEIYTHLSYQPHQGDSKNSRNFWVLEGALFGLAGSTATLLGMSSPLISAGIQAGALATQIALIANYSLEHPKQAARDFESLIVTQFQLAALTGVGNLAPKGKFDAARLNTIMVGPMKRRLNHMKAILEFDRSVYRAAILTILADNNGNMPQGSYQASVSAFPSTGTPNARLKYVTDAYSRLYPPHKGPPAPLLAKALDILGLYDDNEKNIKWLGEGGLTKLLGDESTLPIKTREILAKSLLFACGNQEQKAENREADDELAKLKGLVEILNDLASTNQIVQKEGQNFAGYGGGPATPLVIKTTISLIQAGLYTGISADAPAEVEQRLLSAVNGLNLAGNLATLGAAIFAFSIAYTAYENIALKELQRQRDVVRGASMPNAGVTALKLFLGFFRENKPDNFNTLAAASITDQPEPVAYESQRTFLADTIEQIEAPNLSKWFEYFKIEPTRFIVTTPEAATKLMYDTLIELEAVVEKEEVQPDALHQINRSSESSTEDREIAKGKDHDEQLNVEMPLFSSQGTLRLRDKIFMFSQSRDDLLATEDLNQNVLLSLSQQDLRLNAYLNEMLIELKETDAYPDFEVEQENDSNPIITTDSHKEVIDFIFGLGIRENDIDSLPKAAPEIWRTLEFILATSAENPIDIGDVELAECRNLADALMDFAEGNSFLYEHARTAKDRINNLFKHRDNQQKVEVSIQ